MGLEDAEDFIELGIEGLDKVVDKHFHKVPDKYIDPHTYSVRRHRSGSRKESRDSAPGDVDGRRRDSDALHAQNPLRESDEEADGPRGAGAADDYDPRYSPEYTTRRSRTPQPVGFGESASGLQYPYKSNSRESYDPRTSTRSPPAASYYPGSSYEYVAPPPQPAAAIYDYNPSAPGRPQPEYVNTPGGMLDPSGYNYLPPAPPPPPIGSEYGEDRRSRPRRGMERRSSSQPPRDREREREREREGKRDYRRRSASDDRNSSATEKGGGGGDDGQSKTGKVMLTLLGAAVGGLAVSAVMDRMEKKGDRSDDGGPRVGGRAATGGKRSSGGGVRAGGGRSGGGGGRR